VAWQVYILRCADGTLYTGATNDLERRLGRHRAGQGSRYTRSRLPVRLVFRQGVRNRSAALRREATIKRLSRAEKLRLIRSQPGPQVNRVAAAPRVAAGPGATRAPARR